MQSMQNFILWFLGQLPSFFLSEPMVYIFGFVLLAFVIHLIFKLIGFK